MADDLRQLASQIKQASANDRNLTDGDIRALSRALEQAKGDGGVGAVELASKTAVAEATTILRRTFPSINTIKNALFNSNPLITATVDAFRRSEEALKEQEKKLTKNHTEEVTALERQLRQLTDTAKKQDQTEEAVQASTNTLTGVFSGGMADAVSELQMTRFLLEEAVEQLKYSNNLEENILDENRRSKLASLGVDEDSLPTPAPIIPAAQRDGEGGPDAFDIIGVVGGATGLLAGLGGLFGAGGLFAANGKFLTSVKGIVRTGGRLLGPIAAIAFLFKDFYDGFTEAEEIYGENATFIDQFKSGFSRMVGGIFKPIDLAVSYLTGVETDLAGFVEERVRTFTDGFHRVVGGALTSIVEFIRGAFAGVTADTAISAIPGIIWGNIEQSVMNGLQRLQDSVINAFDTGLGVILSGGGQLLSTLLDMLGRLRDAIGESITSLYNSAIDSLSSTVAPISDYFSEQLGALKITSPTQTPVVGVNGSQNGARFTPLETPTISEGGITTGPDNTAVVKALQELKGVLSNTATNNIIAPQSINASSRTTVVKAGGMSTYSGTRDLF